MNCSFSWRRAALATTALVCPALLGPSPAEAACTLNGSILTCAGTTAGPQNFDGLTATVQGGASVNSTGADNGFQALAGGAGTLTNGGAITVINGFAVNLNSANNHVTNNLLGVLSVTGTGGGVLFGAAATGNTITNKGTITSLAAATSVVDFKGAGNTFTNFGTVALNNDTSSGQAIRFSSGSSGNTLVNHGFISGADSQTILIATGSGNNHIITNYGTIEAEDEETFQIDAGSGHQVTNYGTITSEGDDAMRVNKNATNVVVNNYGTMASVEGNGTRIQGLGTVFNNYGTVEREDIGTAGTHFAVRQTNNNATTFNNFGDVVGSISLEGPASGTALFNNTGNIFLRVQPEGNSAAFDQIKVTATHALLDTTGGQVWIQPVVGTTPYGASTTYTKVFDRANNAAGITGLPGAFGITSDFLSAALVANGTTSNDFDVTITRLPFNAPAAAVSGNELAVLNVFEAFYPEAVSDPSSDFAQVLMEAQVGTVGTFATLAGEAHTTVQVVGQAMTQKLTDNVMQQLWGRGGPGAPQRARASDGAVAYAGPNVAQFGPGPRSMGDWSAWASGYGAFGDVSGSGGLTGYEYRLGGFSAGIDKRVMPNLLVGVVGGYTRADINLAGVEDKVGSDGGQIGVYGSWASGPLQVSGLLSYGFNQNRSTRRVTLNSIDTLTFGEYGSQNFGAAVMAGYTLVTPFADIQPIASVEYVNVHTNGFTESGAEPLNLVVNGNDSDSLRPGVGVRLAKTFIGAPMFGSAGPVVWMPEAHARWTHELLDNTHVITAAFSGAQSAGTFQGSGVATGRSQILAGGGLSVLPNGNDALKVFAGYNADLRDKLTAHVFNAGVRMTW